MSGYTHRRARATRDTTTLTGSSRARTYGRRHPHIERRDSYMLGVCVGRVGVWTCSVLLTRPDEMMLNCERECELYRFYKMAGYKWRTDGTRAYVADHMKDYPNACECMQRCATDGRETLWRYVFAHTIIIRTISYSIFIGTSVCKSFQSVP